MKTRNKRYDKSRLRLLCLLTALLGIFGAGQIWAQTKPSSGTGTQASPYQITTADELFWFAGLVNGTLTDGTAQNTAAWATLTDDIDLSGEAWTPIGNYSASTSLKYTGTFDGAGHTISNLTTVDNSSSNYQGFVGYLGTNGVIKNLTLDGSCSVSGKEYVGGVCGYNYDYGTTITITNCYNTGTVSGSSYVGGVCGWNYNGTLTNCYNNGAVSGSSYIVGGVCGSNNYGTITNCYNIGEVSGSSYAGGVSGYNSSGTITNCYWLNTACSTGIGSGSGEATSKTADQFKSGEVAYLLNGSKSEGTLAWYQNLDNGQTVDDYPVLDSTHGTVYVGENQNCDGTPIGGTYTNTRPEQINRAEHDFDADGFCSVCGRYQPAEEKDGVYQITNAGQLFWFAALVNGDATHAEFDSQNADASAVLTADITIPEGHNWTPMGRDFENNFYAGAFDGAGHTISGMVVNNPDSSYQGFVGCLGADGTIKNLTLDDTCSVCGSTYVGGICGRINSGTITNCYNTGKVSGNNDMGGVCGYNIGTITNCYNAGTVNGSGNYVGGVCGRNYNGTLTNCYWLGTSCSTGIGYGSGEATAKTAEQFKSGEVAYLLQGSQTALTWGQAIGTDDYPVLTTDGAKKVYTYKLYNGSDAAEAGYSNSGASISLEGNAVAVVEAADFTAAAGDANVIVKNGDAYTCANLKLTDGADFYTPVAFTATQATYSRPLTTDTQWGTVALPFDATSVTGAELFRVDRQEGNTLYVDETGGMADGEPLVFRANADVTTVDFKGTDVTVRASTDAATAGSTQLVGTSQAVSKLDAGAYFIYGDMFYQVASGSQVGVKAFRAYIPATAAGASTRSAGAASQLRIVFNADK